MVDLVVKLPGSEIADEEKGREVLPFNSITNSSISTLPNVVCQ